MAKDFIRLGDDRMTQLDKRIARIVRTLAQQEKYLFKQWGEKFDKNLNAYAHNLKLLRRLQTIKKGE